MKNKESILVTGASGFIGSRLAIEMSKSYEVYAYGRSLTTYSLKSFEGKILDIDINKNQRNLHKFDCIINCIALTDTQDNDWESYYNSNCMTTLSLLKNFKFKKFIQLSSFSVLDKNSISSNQFNPENYYGLSKLVSEKMLEIQYTNDKLFSIIRFPIVIGDQKTHRDIIDYIFEQSVDGKKIELYDDGKSFKNLIHVSEATKAIISLYDSQKLPGFNAFNIGASNLMALNDICRYIKKATNSKSEILRNNSKKINDYSNLLKYNQLSRSLTDSAINYESRSVEKNLGYYLSDKGIF